ncbi:MAG: OmpH family outer membrane protein [Pseudomonadota bacterium]
MKRGRAFLVAALFAFGALSGIGSGPAIAQDSGVFRSEILVIDPERVFEGSRLGRSMLAQHQAEREALAAANEKLAAELEAEEQRLTGIRSETDPSEFRDMADAFDTRVQEIRADSERRVRDLERAFERLPSQFLAQVEQIILDEMRAAGGIVLLDQRSVILRADVVDITDRAIARIDDEFGDGPGDAGQD